jgi:hypothetical protein
VDDAEAAVGVGVKDFMVLPQRKIEQQTYVASVLVSPELAVTCILKADVVGAAGVFVLSV